MVSVDKICSSCDCYDEDYGCTMSSFDKQYACPLNDVSNKNKKFSSDKIDDYDKD